VTSHSVHPPRPHENCLCSPQLHRQAQPNANTSMVLTIAGLANRRSSAMLRAASDDVPRVDCRQEPTDTSAWLRSPHQGWRVEWADRIADTDRQSFQSQTVPA
jgi:hypothetical protein